jgi:hypothetical protein
MKTLKFGILVLFVAVCLPRGIAAAQWDASPEEEPYSTAPTPPPAPPEQMVSTTPQSFVEEPPEKKGLDVSFTWSLGIGVPIVLDVPRDEVRPGANLFFFGGADFGWFILGGDVGLQWSPINLDNVPPVNGVVLSGRHPLTRIYLTLPEVRFQVPDLKVVLPYISGAFDMNFWNFAEQAYGCGYWYCSAYNVYRFTPGFTGKGGLGFEIKNGVYIDTGFQFSFTGKGNFFAQSGWWLAPYVGVLVRRR